MHPAHSQPGAMRAAPARALPSGPASAVPGASNRVTASGSMDVPPAILEAMKHAGDLRRLRSQWMNPDNAERKKREEEATERLQRIASSRSGTPSSTPNATPSSSYDTVPALSQETLQIANSQFSTLSMEELSVENLPTFNSLQDTSDTLPHIDEGECNNDSSGSNGIREVLESDKAKWRERRMIRKAKQSARSRYSYGELLHKESKEPTKASDQDGIRSSLEEKDESPPATVTLGGLSASSSSMFSRSLGAPMRSIVEGYPEENLRQPNPWQLRSGNSHRFFGLPTIESAVPSESSAGKSDVDSIHSLDINELRIRSATHTREELPSFNEDDDDLDLVTRPMERLGTLELRIRSATCTRDSLPSCKEESDSLSQEGESEEELEDTDSSLDQRSGFAHHAGHVTPVFRR
eukprot:TRINITY_DN10654_c1_g2_i1.p1 TRINITY_DN10654_c1_g2~~TRINITY_DN10654_c1_g2_i1.p1  ORF type:complete len:409 (+),score=77.88 TRINITY_DN10654_c1_g2_i1:76-1302(+)